MSPNAQRLARWIAVPSFMSACIGWTAGLLQVQATASFTALLATTSCGLLAFGSLVTLARLRPAAAR
jgi:hypothetical protein